MNTIPARYVGASPVRLPLQGAFYDANGQRLTSRLISNGDVIMMPEREVLGFTLLHADQLYDMGTGRMVKPEHQSLSDDELMAIGYEFHQGRPDFRAVVAQPTIVDAAPAQPVEVPPAAAPASAPVEPAAPTTTDPFEDMGVN